MGRSNTESYKPPTNYNDCTAVNGDNIYQGK